MWRDHFDSLSNPRDDPSFNDENFHKVTREVQEWFYGSDTNVFLEQPFTIDEVKKVMGNLNSGKTPGHDGVTSEHIKKTILNMAEVLSVILSACVKKEYIPHNLRRGIQVPLYKGKNTFPLELDNYRGKTLLSTFHKMFEALV